MKYYPPKIENINETTKSISLDLHHCTQCGVITCPNCICKGKGNPKLHGMPMSIKLKINQQTDIICKHCFDKSNTEEKKKHDLLAVNR